MTTAYETYRSTVAAGERLTRDQLLEIAASPDILALGMLADEARRRVHGARVTFVRVATSPFDTAIAETVPDAAREVRLTGAPGSLAVAVSAVLAAKAVAGERAVSGFSLADLQAIPGESLAGVLRRLREAGLEVVSEVPVDKLAEPREAVDSLVSAGFTRVRLTAARPAADQRVAVVLRAAELAMECPAVESIDPLPLSLAAFRPTTGYEDVKVVALARLASPDRVHVQVDWQRYGPKLAQVALTFGADDLDNVSASDEAPDGRRRAPLEEVRRNIEAAGFDAVERDGRWQ